MVLYCPNINMVPYFIQSVNCSTCLLKQMHMHRVKRVFIKIFTLTISTSKIVKGVFFCPKFPSFIRVSIETRSSVLSFTF